MYIPTDIDKRWMLDMVRSLRIGGIWVFPDARLTFQKTSQNELTLVKREEHSSRVFQDDMIQITNDVLSAIGMRLVLP